MAMLAEAESSRATTVATVNSSVRTMTGLLIGALLGASVFGCASRTGGPDPDRAMPPSNTSPAGPATPDVGLVTPELVFNPSDGASAQNACFSPDGRTILFTLFHEGYNDGPAGLYIVSAEGGRPRAVLDEPGTDNVNLPGTSWNAATNRIAFASDREDVDEVWTAAPTGRDPVRVTRHAGPRHFIEPSFSPDGRWIVFEVGHDVSEERQTGSVFKVRAGGLGLKQLTPGAAVGGTPTDNRLPNWSPQGDRILFQRRRPGSDDWDIWTMRPDGKGARPVTGTGAAVNLSPGARGAARSSTTGSPPSSDTDASWSPDGGWICYSSDHGGLAAPNIFIIAADGGRPIRVTNSSTHEHAAPSFSPDGRWIAFESHPMRDGVESGASLWRVRAPRLR